MATAKPPPNREFVETGSEPEYFCTYTRTEAASNGNVRIYCYAERHKNQFHLLYTVVIPAAELAGMGRRALEASSEAHNLSQMRDDETMQ